MQSRHLRPDGHAKMLGTLFPEERGGGGTGRNARLMTSALALAGIVAVLSCGGDGAVEPDPPPAPVATTVAVSPGSAALTALGETARFTAEVRDQNGQVMAGAAVAWASSDPSVAMVDGAGLVTAAANGAATVTATAGSVSGTAAVTVTQSPDAVAVSPEEAAFAALGDTVRVAAEAFDANGHAVAGTEFEWASSDEAVATVDGSGLVTAVANGTATITASAGGASGTVAVTVAQAVQAVMASPPADTLLAFGDTVRLTAEATDANGHAVAGAEFEWESSNDAVATVDGTGLVTSVANGTATITASAGGASGTATVTVTQSPASVAVSPAQAAIAALGEIVRLTAQGLDANGHPVADADFEWASSNNAVATVDGSGLVTAVANGTATITASAGGASGTATVTVTQSPASVAVSPAEATIAALGGTLRLTAEAFDANDHRVSGVAFSWASSSESVATVDRTGLVTAVAYGTATITANAGRARGESVITVTSGADRAALVAFYDATGGEDWGRSDNWLTDAQIGQWYGVRVNRAGQVRSITLPRNNLTGSLPAEIGDLSELEILDLHRNWRPGRSTGLTGPIPRELANLAKLTEIRLSSNELTGPIPTELGGMINLVRLDLGWNDLTGSIPDELSRLTNLNYLDLAQNNLAGTIPTWIGDLSGLGHLDLHGNGLTGEIPAELARLTSLRLLNLSFNSLSGSIPPEFGDLSNLLSLFLGYNRLTGDVPSELGGLSRLLNLQLNRNKLTGAIPNSFLELELFSFFAKDNESVCLPNTAGFATWLSRITQHDDPPKCESG